MEGARYGESSKGEESVEMIRCRSVLQKKSQFAIISFYSKAKDAGARMEAELSSNRISFATP